MLVLTRQATQVISIGNMFLMIRSTFTHKVHLGLLAPTDVPLHCEGPGVRLDEAPVKRFKTGWYEFTCLSKSEFQLGAHREISVTVVSAGSDRARIGIVAPSYVGIGRLDRLPENRAA